MRKRLAALVQRAQAWLRREAYVRAAIEAATAQALEEGYRRGHEVGQKALYEACSSVRRIALAEGELLGRQALAHELELSFNADSGRDLTAEDVKSLRARQLH